MGSEMCIRDRWAALRAGQGNRTVLALLLLLAVAAVFGWGLAVSASWDAIRARTAGSAGTMHVDHCSYKNSGTRGWLCQGQFVATDGRQFGPTIAFVDTVDEPGSTIQGRADGPGAGTMWPTGGYQWIAAILAVVVLPWCLRWIYREAVDTLAPAGGWPRH